MAFAGVMQARAVEAEKAIEDGSFVEDEDEDPDDEWDQFYDEPEVDPFVAGIPMEPL
jgi:hypothetical protein